MTKASKALTIIFGIIIVSLITPTTAMAMVTPGSQMMTLVVINAPDDLEMQILHYEDLDDWFRARVNSRLWETYYRFILCTEPASGWPYEEITILISSEEHGEFEMTFPVPHSWRDFSFRIDLETQTFTQAYTHVRNLLIVLCWIIPLFLIDSLVFFLFGHRKKESWKVFAITNLAMQGLFLGIWSVFHIFLSSNIFFAVMTILLIPGARLAKWIVEIVVYKTTITEHSKTRSIACALAINLIGVFLVILLGMHIPLPG